MSLGWLFVMLTPKPTKNRPKKGLTTQKINPNNQQINKLLCLDHFSQQK